MKWLFGKEIEIPEEWEVKKFNEIFDFLRTGTNSRSDLSESGDAQYIHYGDIHTKWNLILECKSAKIPFIENDKIKNLSLLKDGDLIIADASEDHEGSGASILLKNIENKQIVSGLHTIALRDNSQITQSEFRAYITSIKFVKIQIIAQVTGISVFGLSKTNLKKMKIPIPLLPEQQKIASILSGVDALIESTQKVIEKTERLKKGLMQKLLTKGIGHTKFKKVKWHFGKEIEIPEEWEVKKFNEIFDFLRTGTNSRSDLSESGDAQYIHYGDIHTKWNLILECKSAKIPFIENDKIKNLSLLKDGDLIIADASEDHEGSGASILLKNIENEQIVSGLHTIALRDNSQITQSEFRAYITSIKFVTNSDNCTSNRDFSFWVIKNKFKKDENSNSSTTRTTNQDCVNFV